MPWSTTFCVSTRVVARALRDLCSKLNLLLEEGGITTECTLCTVSDSQEGDDGADFESAFQ